MKAEETRLRPLIEPTKQLIIPLFQRFYIWDKKYWDILWNDLGELASDEDQQRTHFLGSLVFIPDENSSPSLSRFVVIDGQQRITTLLVILAAIRDLARAEEQINLADEINNKMLSNQYKQEDDYYKLLLSDNDHDAFQNILDEKQHQVHRLSDCYRYFREQINKHVQEFGSSQLRSMFEIIADRFSLVTITLATNENPYLVFESLNFKGHKLTEADLIRNYLFMRVPSKQQKSVYKEYWKPMEISLGDNLTEFVRHYLIMRTGTFVKKNEVYIKLKNDLSATEVLPSIKKLATFGSYYKKLLDPIQEPNKSISDALKRLNQLDTTTIYPFLLNCYQDYDQKHLTAEQFCDVVKQIENYLVRHFVCGSPSNELNKFFAPLYNQIAKQVSDNFATACTNILQKSKKYPNDAQFKSNLMTRKLYAGSNSERKTRFILESLERHHKHKEPVSFASLTIEHIMPQTLTDWWKEHLGDAWSEVHETYLHTLGNLTLTGYNSELSNAPFPDKRQEFVTNSHLVLNSYFKKVNSWCAKDIQNRAEQLAEQALNCWPYLGDANQGSQKIDGVIGTKPVILKVLDKTFPVKSWIEVLQRTLQTLAEQAPNRFAQLTDRYPHYIANNPHGLKRPKQLIDNYYIETGFKAENIDHFCRRVIDDLGYPPTVWVVITKD
ncbi:DUF262 domain-containing protein [Thiospirillum jenense]|uniref:DUF262 domain-containing protein n=1 Tax=Thiospirillum jenense TaxID=1653858 RepID=A0A839H6H4_9GAMM|nr:DUF262 domain-containing protein [Thiospirillum jenense]MBB1125111.1 DUF262 domain-containing protein [Thiospirillum jenense]